MKRSRLARATHKIAEHSPLKFEIKYSQNQAQRLLEAGRGNDTFALIWLGGSLSQKDSYGNHMMWVSTDELIQVIALVGEVRVMRSEVIPSLEINQCEEV
jgi:hypothetical protein